MKRLLGTALAILFATAIAMAKDQSWKGTISDSMCGASHKAGIEHAGKKQTDRECAQACVKAGAKYVFVSGGKVYNIENQDYMGLSEHVGHNVTVSGTMT